MDIGRLPNLAARAFRWGFRGINNPDCLKTYPVPSEKVEEKGGFASKRCVNAHVDLMATRKGGVDNLTVQSDPDIFIIFGS